MKNQFFNDVKKGVSGAAQKLKQMTAPQNPRLPKLPSLNPGRLKKKSKS
jgi:hypothetical protein